MLAYRKNNILVHVEAVEQSPSLKKETVVRSDGNKFLVIQLVDALALVVNVPGRGTLKGDHVLHEHRLTASAGTDDNRGLALFSGEGNVVKNYCRIKHLCKILNNDKRVFILNIDDHANSLQ